MPGVAGNAKTLAKTFKVLCDVLRVEWIHTIRVYLIVHQPLNKIRRNRDCARTGVGLRRFQFPFVVIVLGIGLGHADG